MRDQLDDALHCAKLEDAIAICRSGRALIAPSIILAADMPQNLVHEVYTRLGAEILLYRTSSGVLDRGASLDDAGYKSGSSIGGLPKSGLDQRARCAAALKSNEEMTPAGDQPKRLI